MEGLVRVVSSRCDADLGSGVWSAGVVGNPSARGTGIAPVAARGNEVSVVDILADPPGVYEEAAGQRVEPGRLYGVSVRRRMMT